MIYLIIYLLIGLLGAVITKHQSDEDMPWWFMVVFTIGYPFLILWALRSMRD